MTHDIISSKFLILLQIQPALLIKFLVLTFYKYSIADVFRHLRRSPRSRQPDDRRRGPGVLHLGQIVLQVTKVAQVTVDERSRGPAVAQLKLLSQSHDGSSQELVHRIHSSVWHRRHQVRQNLVRAPSWIPPPPLLSNYFHKVTTEVHKSSCIEFTTKTKLRSCPFPDFNPSSQK
jgi:hypothetical protein